MNLKSIFAKVLPTIAATVIPGGPLAQMGISVLANALGVDKIDPTPEAMDAAIVAAQSKNPEVLLALKKVDADLQMRLAEMGYDSEEKILGLQNADRSDARAREIAVRDRTPAYLAGFVTAGFFALLAALVFKAVPEGSQTILNIMVGALGTAWAGIVSYYFGSSSGSAAKTAIIADQAKSDR